MQGKGNQGKSNLVAVVMAGLFVVALYWVIQKVRNFPYAPDGVYDLKPHFMSWNPKQPVAGTPLEFRFTVQNVGASFLPTGTYDVDVYIDDKKVGFDYNPPGIHPMQLVGYPRPGEEWAYTPTQPGVFTLKIVLDPNDRVEETNEDNNILTIDFEVAEASAATPPETPPSTPPKKGN